MVLSGTITHPPTPLSKIQTQRQAGSLAKSVFWVGPITLPLKKQGRPVPIPYPNPLSPCLLHMV
jgi:hypothetical protein